MNHGQSRGDDRRAWVAPAITDLSLSDTEGTKLPSYDEGTMVAIDGLPYAPPS